MSGPIFNSYGNDDIHLEDLKNYYENSHIFVIGINKYREESPLTNAENDATAITNVLEKKYGFNVMRSLFNEQATGDQIREIFVDILPDETKIKPKDRVIIYYSGHGKLRTILGRDGQEIREGYIVPYDSKRERFGANIPMKTVIEGCQNCPAKHVLLILDCCYSGFAANRAIQSSQRSYAATEDYIKDISSRAAVQVFAAGQEDQPVSDSGIRPGYSAFTGALLDILEPEVDPDNNGILTASEIGYNLERQVAVQEQRGSFQRPVYSHLSGSQGGDFIFKIFKLKKLTTPPTVEHKSIETTSGVPIEVVLSADNLDPDDIARFSLVNTPEHGIIKSGITNNRLVYTPYTEFAGEDRLTYKATNSQGVDSNIATINIIIKPVPPLKPSPPETNKQYQQQHQQRSLFGNPKVLIPIIAAIAAAVIVLAVFGSGIMHQQQQQSQPAQQPSTSAPSGNPNPMPPINNEPPTAVAGTSQVVKSGDKVTLNGSGSKDPDGRIAKYLWTQTSGPAVILNGADTSRPSFIAPIVSSDTVLHFSLTVTDDKGDTSNSPATVTITMKPSTSTSTYPNPSPLSPQLSPTSNHSPTASDLSVFTKQNTPLSITLAGSDPDQNSTLTAAIVTKPSHGTLGTINQDTGTTTYTPNPGFTGTDSFRFKVNDGKINSNNTGTVYIKINGAKSL